jgi:hypothetical protein
MPTRSVLLLTDHPGDGEMYVAGLSTHGFQVKLADDLENLTTAIRAGDLTLWCSTSGSVISDCGLGSRRSGAAISSTYPAYC